MNLRTAPTLPQLHTKVATLAAACRLSTAALAGGGLRRCISSSARAAAVRHVTDVMTKTPLSTAGTGAVFPEQYDAQLQDKLARVRELFAGFTLPDIEVHRSAPSHYRMRTEFRVWHEGSDLCYVMFEQPPAEGAPDAAADSRGNGDTSAAAAAAADAPAAGGQDDQQPQPGQQQQQGQQQARGQKKRRHSRSPSRGAAAAAAAAAAGSGRKRVARVRIDKFPVASELICALMPLLREQLMRSSVLRDKLFQVNFHTSLSRQAVVTLTYHKQLDEGVWREAAQALRAHLREALGPDVCSELHVVGRSRKQKLMLDAEHVIEQMHVAGRTYEYMQVAGCFSQPNGGMCQSMLSWAVDATAGSSGDLLELYCGAGTFTLPLAQNFKQVVATEVSKASVAAARHNIAANGVANVFLARMSSEEFVETWRVKGSRFRLTGLDWDALQLNTLLVDPPRAGLDPDTEALLQDFEQVVYISCNPETLAANLRSVAATHAIERFAVFDQFPYTHHLECGAFLRRKKAEA